MLVNVMLQTSVNLGTLKSPTQGRQPWESASMMNCAGCTHEIAQLPP